MDVPHCSTAGCSLLSSLIVVRAELLDFWPGQRTRRPLEATCKATRAATSQGRGWLTAVGSRGTWTKVAKVVKQAKRPPVRSCRNVAGLTWRVSEIATKPARSQRPRQPVASARGPGPHGEAPGEARLLSRGLRWFENRARARAGSRWGCRTPAFAGKEPLSPSGPSGQGAPVPLRPLRAQARRRQNPKDGCNPNPATSAKASPQPTTYYDEAGKLAPLPIDRHFRPLQVPAFTVIFSAPASRGRPSRSAAVKAACRLTDS